METVFFSTVFKLTFKIFIFKTLFLSSLYIYFGPLIFCIRGGEEKIKASHWMVMIRRNAACYFPLYTYDI